MDINFQAVALLALGLLTVGLMAAFVWFCEKV